MQAEVQRANILMEQKDTQLRQLHRELAGERGQREQLNVELEHARREQAESARTCGWQKEKIIELEAAVALCKGQISGVD